MSSITKTQAFLQHVEIEGIVYTQQGPPASIEKVKHFMKDQNLTEALNSKTARAAFSFTQMSDLTKPVHRKFLISFFKNNTMYKKDHPELVQELTKLSVNRVNDTKRYLLSGILSKPITKTTSSTRGNTSDGTDTDSSSRETSPVPPESSSEN